METIESKGVREGLGIALRSDPPAGATASGSRHVAGPDAADHALDSELRTSQRHGGHTPRSRVLSPLLACLAFICAITATAADKSGVSPSSISVPKGPGSIEGLGESFQPSLNSGTAKHSVKLRVPNGVAGLEPQLELIYESGNGNGPLGLGWRFGLDFIQRMTDQGMPTYGLIPNFPRPDKFISDAKEELVPTAGGYYFSKNEGAFVRYVQFPDHWEADEPSGARLLFGLDDSSRIEDTNTTPARIFSWLLQKQVDTHGNMVVFSYTNFPGSNNVNQKYLSNISYGPGAAPWTNFHFVQFIYEDRPDWIEDCRGGFPVRTGKRLNSIAVGTQGPSLAGHNQGDFNNDGVPDNLDFLYKFSYLPAATNGAVRSFLSAIQEFGADGATSIPASLFAYNYQVPPDVMPATSATIFGTNEPNYVMDNTLVDLVDANGDGLPDILKTDPSGGQQTVYLNQGSTNIHGTTFSLWSGPKPIQGNALAWNFALSQTSVHLADMDGDGLADLVVKSAFDQVAYFPNLGTNAWGNRRPLANADYPPPAPFAVTNVRTADLDFDKRFDIFQCDGIQYHLWLNLGNGQYFNRITVPETNGFDFALPQVQVVDFNGDRVPDVAWIRPTEIIVTAGLGYAQFAPAINVPIPDFPPGSTRYLTADLMSRAKLQDIDGDGLADLVIERVPGNELWYWLNQGNYTLSGPKVLTGMPSVISSSAVTRWADINGNGTTDLIYADSLGTPRLTAIDIGQLLNGGGAANALTSIDNGLGGITRIGYVSSTVFALADAAAGNPWPDPLPFPMNVVASVTNLDSLGGTYVRQFAYHNPYYDPVQHQFRGFGRAEQVDVGDASAPTLVSRTTFDTGKTYEAMKGKTLVTSAEQAGGGVFWSATNSFTTPPVTLYAGTNGTNVSIAYAIGTVKIVSELGNGSPVRLESSVAFDNYGNQTMAADYGFVVNGDRTAGQDERIVRTVYAVNTNLWLLRLPARQEISGLTNPVISRVEYYYDDPTWSGNNFGAVVRGDLTLLRAWTNASIASGYVTSERMKYDSYGNPVQSLDPLAFAPGGALDASKGHSRDLVYDPLFHTHPASEIVHPGGNKPDMVFTATFDAGWGMPISSVDLNSNLTLFTYDPLARIKTITQPDDLPGFPSSEFAYVLGTAAGGGGVINYVETRELVASPTAPGDHLSHYYIAREFVDGLGRKRMTRAQADPDPVTGLPRVAVHGVSLYNARAKPARTLSPFFSLSGATNLTDLLAYEDVTAPGWQGSFELYSNLVSLNLSAAHSISVSYDELLRNLGHTNADGTVATTSYAPLSDTAMDENQNNPLSRYFGASRVRHSDGLGRLTAYDEVARLNDDGTPASTLRAWTTRYQYDVNGNLIQAMDSQGNIQSIFFDGLKRRLSVNDPDRGTVSYTYDDASNRIQTTDAKNQVVSYFYDGLNRIIGEDYRDEGASFSANHSYNPSQPITTANRPDVAFFYDQPVANLDQGDDTVGTARNTIGRLAYVWDLSGEEHHSYDIRGRPEYTIKRLPDPVRYPSLMGSNAPANPALVSYKTSMLFDSASRISNVTYPDNDQVTYQYSARSLLQAIPGGPNGTILSNIRYGPSGDILAEDFGNGVRSIWERDNRLRPTRIAAVRTQSVGLAPQIMDLGYQYDAVDNPKQITDQRSAAAVPAGDKRRNTQLFQYDDLYRLTGVQYSLAAPGSTNSNDGIINYRYDRIGNPLSQTSTLPDTDPRTALPAVNLGTMRSGGTAGSSNRVGRGPADGPGPHALTQITAAQSGTPVRDFSYDANGNMSDLDGATLTWDFSDRLVAAENATMRSEYTYDYQGRRIRKVTNYKPGSTNYSEHDSFVYVLYPGTEFEVREHETPTKYIFAGDNPIAHVSGAISSRPLVQRLRLRSGWNLCSLIVSPTNFLGQVSSGPNTGLVGAAYLWNPAVSNFVSVSAGQTLPAGSVLWLYSTGPGMLAFSGQFTPATDAAVPPSGTFVAATGFLPWPISQSSGSGETVWAPDAGANDWLLALGNEIQSASDAPPLAPPGSPFYVRCESTSLIHAPDPALQVRYYHEDHLGSASCVSDANGAVVDEKAFYPFGAVRYEMAEAGATDPYGFIHRETDVETGLIYTQARYLVAGLGRFLSVDPIAAAGHPDPQRGNLYVYAANRPLASIDPDGREVIKLGNYFEFVTPSASIVLPGGIELYNSDKTKQGNNQVLFVNGGAYNTAQQLHISSGPTEKVTKAGTLRGVSGKDIKNIIGINVTVQAQANLGKIQTREFSALGGLFTYQQGIKLPYVNAEAGYQFVGLEATAKASALSSFVTFTYFGIKVRAELGLAVAGGVKLGKAGEVALPGLQVSYDTTPLLLFLVDKAAEFKAGKNIAKATAAYQSAKQTVQSKVTSARDAVLSAPSDLINYVEKQRRIYR